MGTVFVNIWYDDLYDDANNAYKKGGKALKKWNKKLEEFRQLSADLKKELDENGLKRYDLTIDLPVDGDTDNCLAEFTNGVIIHDAVAGY